MTEDTYNKLITVITPTQLATGNAVTRVAVYKWLRARKIPAERVLRVEELTGISRHDLRPDVFGKKAA